MTESDFFALFVISLYFFRLSAFAFDSQYKILIRFYNPQLRR